MESNRADVIQLLEKERQWHLDQVKHINCALVALTNGTEAIQNGVITSPKVSWTTEIKALFNELHEIDELSVNDIRNRLIENGVTKALERNSKNTIIATLRRMVQSKDLVKTSQGTYKKPLSVPFTPDGDIPF